MPVDESDWTAFEAILDAPKRKAPPVLYFKWAAALFVVFGLVGSLWYFAEIHRKAEPLVQNPSEQSANQTQENTANTSQSSSHDAGKIEQERATQETPIPSETFSQSPRKLLEAYNPSASSTDRSDAQPQSSQEIVRHPNRDVKIISPRVLLIPTPSWGWFEHASLAPYTAKNETNQDSSAISNKNKDKYPKKFTFPAMGPSLSIGFAYGFGSPKLVLKNAAPEKVHEDYNSTLRSAKKQTQSFRFEVNYEYRFLSGLHLTTGLNIISSTQIQQFNFENRKIPYLDVNGDILTYIQVPPSQSVTPTIFTSRQNINTVSIPVGIGYSYRISNRFSLGIRGRAGLGINWSNPYLGLDPVTLTEQNVRSSVNPFNFQAGGGVFGEYLYLEKWSVRGSFDWQTQNKQYKNSNNYNLINRYYLIKLSLVRYL